MIRHVLAAVCVVAALAAGVCYHVAGDRDRDKEMRLESLMWLVVFVVIGTRLV